MQLSIQFGMLLHPLGQKVTNSAPFTFSTQPFLLMECLGDSTVLVNASVALFLPSWFDASMVRFPQTSSIEYSPARATQMLHSPFSLDRTHEIQAGYPWQQHASCGAD